MQVQAKNTLNVFRTSVSIPYPQSTLNANTESLSNRNSALLAPRPYAIIATPRSTSPVLIRALPSPLGPVNELDFGQSWANLDPIFVKYWVVFRVDRLLVF